MGNYWHDYFNNVYPTWMENWYDQLEHLTIPSVMVPVTIEEVNLLLDLENNNYVGPIQLTSKLKAAINKICLKHNTERVFVRLGSRSPKDNMGDVPYVRGYKNIYAQFANSKRITEDLILCQHIGYEPFIFVRKWVDMHPKDEFRCFVKDGKLVGVSQYYYQNRFFYLDNENTRAHIISQAKLMSEEIVTKGKTYHFNQDNFVFDILYQEDKKMALLIEINPWSSWTDSMLFDWAKDNFKELELRYTQY